MRCATVSNPGGVGGVVRSRQRSVGLVLVALICLFLTAGGAPLGAQSLQELPGFVDFESFGEFDLDDLTVEINLSGSLLKMLSSAVQEDDGEFAQLLRGLSAVRVNIFEVPAGEAGSSLRTAVGSLRDRGWEAVVSIRDDENLHILLKTEGDKIQGVLAAFSDAKSFGLVNIVGDFDPEQIGRLARQLDIVPLQDLDLGNGGEND